MKIIANNLVFDTSVDAVSLEFTEAEKQHIANMGDQTSYAIFPWAWNKVDPKDKLKFMKGGYLLSGDMRMYFDKARRSLCYRVNTDYRVEMVYPDGSVHQTDMESLILDFVFIMSEQTNNEVLLYEFLIYGEVQVGCRVYLPGEGAYNFKVLGITYHWDTEPVTDEEKRDHGILIRWLHINSNLLSRIELEVAELMRETKRKKHIVVLRK